MQRINVRKPDEWRAFDRLLLILIVILLVILLCLWLFNSKVLPFNCCEDESSPVQTVAETKPEPVPEPVVTKPEPPVVPPPVTPPAPTTPPEIALSLADGRLVVSGMVDSEETKTQVLDRIRQQLPDVTVIDRLSVSDSVYKPTELAAFGSLIGNLQADDRLSMQWRPKSLRLAGTVDSEQRKASLIEAAQSSAFTQALYGDTFDTIDQIEVAKKGPDCSEVLRAAKIEFALGSARLTEKGRIELNKLVPCLQEDAYEVIGHTDSSGSQEINQPLSLARAESAVAYLVSKGLDAGAFSALGMGAKQPIADNATAEGRSHNRRIEFRAK